jgi:hypothetical protein
MKASSLRMQLHISADHLGKVKKRGVIKGNFSYEAVVKRMLYMSQDCECFNRRGVAVRDGN